VKQLVLHFNSPRICFLSGIFPSFSFLRVPFVKWKETSEDELDESPRALNDEMSSVWLVRLT
jgi:hypothetical protein